MAEKSDSLIEVPRLVSSSHIVHMVSKWVHMFPFLAQHMSCSCFRSSTVIICNCLLKLALSVSQASFTAGLPLIFRYKESGIVEAIC